MSWIFSKVLMDSLSLPCSQELVVESLPQRDLESEQSVQLSVSTTQHPFLHNGKIQKTSNLSRFGLTSRALTEKYGEALILSLAASHAKIYQLRASKQGSQEKGQVFGLRWQELLPKSSQDLFSSKTYQPSENTLHISCTTLPPSGTMRNGAVSAQKKLGDYIKEIECGSLEGKNNNENFFPTPSANEDAAGTPNGNMQRMLGNCKEIRGETKEKWEKGSLSADWTEWLMGFPVGWSDLEAIPGEALTWDKEPEGLSRVVKNQKHRALRLKGIGNAQVPQCAATAYQLLLERFN